MKAQSACHSSAPLASESLLLHEDSRMFVPQTFSFQPGFWPIAVLMFFTLTASSQTLPLPPRSSSASTGDAFAESVSSLSRADREERVFQEVMAGNVPQFLRTLVPVSSRATIGGADRAVTWFVLPDYLAIGSDENFFLMPLTPLLAQRLADALRCTMPTRKMVNAIYSNAAVKLAPQPIAPSAAMTTVPVFKQHNDSVRIQRATTLAQYPLGLLVGGHKKDVIISNSIVSNLKPAVPKPVVIYGWHQLNGTPIQPLYNGHGETYADYSHGIRLVQDSVTLDGVPATVASIVTDQTLWPLLSDEGVIPLPRYGAVPSGVEDTEWGEGAPFDADGDAHLFQNAPNPFNPTTTISFAVARTEEVQLVVYDLLGREVRTVLHGVRSPGVHSVVFDGSALASGPLVYTLQTHDACTARVMMLAK